MLAIPASLQGIIGGLCSATGRPKPRKFFANNFWGPRFLDCFCAPSDLHRLNNALSFLFLLDRIIPLCLFGALAHAGCRGMVHGLPCSSDVCSGCLRVRLCGLQIRARMFQLEQCLTLTSLLSPVLPLYCCADSSFSPSLFLSVAPFFHSSLAPFLPRLLSLGLGLDASMPFETACPLHFPHCS